MSNNHKEFHQLRELMLLSLDGNASKDQIAQLEDILRNDSRAREYYRGFLAMYCDMKLVIDSTEEHDSSGDMYSSLLKLAEQESFAPELIIEKPEGTSEIEEVKPARSNRLHKFYSVIISVAAMLMVGLIAYTHLFPAKPSVPTATVLSLANAVWANKVLGLDEGQRINTYSENYSLNSGLVEILYDYGASIIVEGPAEFNIDSEKVLCLNRGRAYASVSTGCTGFTIETPSSVLVDIGTEFGVNVNYKGDSQLHVFKGEVILNTLAGLNSKHLYAGQAATVSSENYSIRSIPINSTFVSGINEPFYFDGFENLPLGPLLDQPGWGTNSVYESGPVVIDGSISGQRVIRGVKMVGKIGGADHALPDSIDLAKMDKPIYASFIMKYDGNETGSDDKEVMLTLSEKKVNNESQGVIEGLFNLDKGTRIQYSVRDSYVREPSSGLDGSLGLMYPERQYLCVLKIMPEKAGNIKVSLGYCDISDGIPDEVDMPYAASASIDPALLIAKDSSGRYHLDHIAVSIRTESIVADNLMVSDMWSHIRLKASR